MELEDNSYLAHIKSARPSGYGKKVPESFKRNLRRKWKEAARTRRRNNSDRNDFGIVFEKGKSKLGLTNSRILHTSKSFKDTKTCNNDAVESARFGPEVEPSIFHHDRRKVLSAQVQNFTSSFEL